MSNNVQVLIAAIATVLAVPILLAALLPDANASDNTGRGRLSKSASARYRQGQLTSSPFQRILAPILAAAAGQARRVTPIGAIDNTTNNLIVSGLANKISLEAMLGLKVILGIAGLALGILFIPFESPVMRIACIGLAAALGFYLPEIYVNRKVEERQAEIRTDLPDVLDQLTVIVEAGLGFDSAIGRLVETGNGALIDEFGRVLRGIRLGQTRAEALEGLAVRTQVPEVKQFVAAIKQTESIGVPMARILRTQSHHMRELKRLAAEERAMKLPVKLVLPMVMCMLPALFLVLIGPVAIRIVSGGLG